MATSLTVDEVRQQMNKQTTELERVEQECEALEEELEEARSNLADCEDKLELVEDERGGFYEALDISLVAMKDVKLGLFTLDEVIKRIEDMT